MGPMNRTYTHSLTFRRVLTVVATLLVPLSISHPVAADPDAEREALARVIHELEALDPLIQRAEAAASPDARIRFRYDWLRQDLSRVRSGIQEHLDAPRNEPRHVPPLRGDYRQ